MTEELDRLKQALDATRAEPDPAARRRAVAAALRAFDGETARASQGSAAAVRPKVSGAGWPARILGGLTMHLPTHVPLPRLTPALMGGASLAVIAIAVLAVREMPREIEAPQGVPPTAVRTEAAAPQAAAGRSGPVFAGKESLARREADLAGSLASDTPAAEERTGARVRRGLMPAPAEAYLPDGRSSTLSKGLTLAAPPAPELEGQSRTAPATAMPALPDQMVQPGYREQGRDRFAEFEDSPVKVAAEVPVSTFSIDADTASYSFVRRAIMEGLLPEMDAVRVEEMINYFPYDYAGPADRGTPFRADVQLVPTPWNAGTMLMRIGIKGYALAEAERPRANLVFLIDSSGSMDAPDKLPLLLNAFRLMLDALDPDDTVAIVTYAGAAGTVLEPTPVAEADRILAALDRLHAGGSTAGAEGIRQAYRMAEASFDPKGVNRVILATDGDFNVGITDTGDLRGFVAREREKGVFLSVLGFGRGNLNDELMQVLAQNGNGQAAYIDTLGEARKALVEEAGSALFPIARDVKIQVEFNPAAVAEYRLIGYETRALARADFNNDRVDAGEIGSGHTVTALYEITPAGSDARLIDALRYRPAAEPEANPAEVALVRIRYKAPEGGASRLIERPVTRADLAGLDEGRARETRFAAAVAAFGQLLRGGRHTGSFSYDDVAALAQPAKGDDPFGYRAEFLNLVRLAKSAAALEPLR